MFVQSVKFIQEHAGNRSNISVFGQEANADTWKMAKMNMAIRGIDANFGDHPEDTFFNDLHSTQKFDFIMANPPFNLSNWGQDKLQNDPRWAYGLPPAGNANYAWIEHMIYHLAPNGKIGLVLANGALSTQTSGEGEIRRKIIEADLIEGIVAMPTQLFYSVTIPVTLWFITRGKKQTGKTLFIDARNMGHMVDRKHRETLGVAFLPENFAPDDAERVGVHRRFMAVLLHVFRDAAAHEPPAGDIPHARQKGIKPRFLHHLLLTFSAKPGKSANSTTVPLSRTAFPVNLPNTWCWSDLMSFTSVQLARSSTGTKSASKRPSSDVNFHGSV
mgnify:CR=1 FL=1